MQVIASSKVTNPEPAAILVILSGLLLQSRVGYCVIRTESLRLKQLVCWFIDQSVRIRVFEDSN